MYMQASATVRLVGGVFVSCPYRDQEWPPARYSGYSEGVLFLQWLVVTRAINPPLRDVLCV